jgi:AcrR family transcriptional regulator
MSPTPRARSATSPRKRPRQERSRETVRAILEAAARVFEAEGLDGATTDRIAARAGVSVGSLYQYFPNKDALLAALGRCHLIEAWRALAPALDALADGPPPETALPQLVRGVVGLHATRSRLHRMLFEQAPPDPELWRALGAGRDAACARIARYLAARPEVRVADPALAARVTFDLLMALVHGFALDPRAGATPERRSDEIVTLLRRYLTGGG